MADLKDIRTSPPTSATNQPLLPSTDQSSRRVRRTQRTSGILISKDTPLKTIAARYEDVYAHVSQASTKRQRDMKRLGRRIAATSSLVFFIVFAVAGLMDLLGLLKLAVEAIPYLGAVVGFAVNFITTPITLLFVTLPIIFAQYRIRRINKNTQAVADYANRLRVEAKQLHRAVRPAMLAMRRSSLAHGTDPSQGQRTGEFVRYRSRILLNNLFILLLESIPYVDAGPWQTLKVWRVYVHQQKEHRRARTHLLAATALAQQISRMEQFYLEYLVFAFERNLALEEQYVQPRYSALENEYAAVEQTVENHPQQQMNIPPTNTQDVALAT